MAAACGAVDGDGKLPSPWPSTRKRSLSPCSSVVSIAWICLNPIVAAFRRDCCNQLSGFETYQRLVAHSARCNAVFGPEHEDNLHLFQSSFDFLGEFRAAIKMAIPPNGIAGSFDLGRNPIRIFRTGSGVRTEDVPPWPAILPVFQSISTFIRVGTLMKRLKTGKLQSFWNRNYRETLLFQMAGG